MLAASAVAAGTATVLHCGLAFKGQRRCIVEVGASAKHDPHPQAEQGLVMRSRRRGLHKTPTDPRHVVRLIVTSLEQDRSNLAKLLQSHARLIQTEECFLLFDYLGRRDMWVQTLEVFRWMQQQKWYRPDNGVYSKLISIIGKKGQIRLVMFIFSQMRKIGCRPDTSVYNALIQAHLHGKDKEKSLEKAFGYFEIMKTKPRCQPNTVTYNILLRACAQNQQIEKVHVLLEEAKSSQIAMDIFTYNGLIDAYGKNGMIGKMELVLSQMKHSKCKPDVITFNLLIDAYGKHQHFDKMEKVFQSLLISGEKPTLPTFNSMITNYGKARLMNKVESTYQQMINSGYEPSNVTYEALIMAYGHCGNVIKAREFFSEMRTAGNRLQISSLHAMLEVYCQNGQTNEADSLFDNASIMGVQPRVSTYKLLFKAYTKAKNGALVDKLVKSMNKNGVIPNKNFLEALDAYASDRSNESEINKRIDFHSLSQNT